MRQTTLLFLAASFVAASFSAVDAQQQRRKDTHTFHPKLSIGLPSGCPSFDLGKSGTGVRLPDGPVVLFGCAFFAARKGGVRTVVKLNGKTINPANASRLARELVRDWKRDYKTVRRTTKPKRLRIRGGKAYLADLTVTGAKTKRGKKMIEAFTTTAPNVDRDRTYDPRTMTIQFRHIVVKGKAGTHVLLLAGAPACFKKSRREITAWLKTLVAR